MCISTKNVGLLPWVVCVSGISSYFDGGSSTRYRNLLLWWSTLREVELWTAGMWFPVRCQTDKQFSSENFLLPDEHLHQDSFIDHGTECYYFSYYCWHIFCHPSTIFLICNLINEHLSSLHSSCRRLLHLNFNWSSVSWLTICWVNFKELCNIVNCNIQTLIMLLLWQPIMIYDYPPIPKTLPHFIYLQRTEIFFYFITNTYLMGIFYLSITLPKLLLPRPTTYPVSNNVNLLSVHIPGRNVI